MKVKITYFDLIIGFSILMLFLGCIFMPDIPVRTNIFFYLYAVSFLGGLIFLPYLIDKKL